MEIDRKEGRREAVLVAAEHGMGIWFTVNVDDDRVVNIDLTLIDSVRRFASAGLDFSAVLDAEELRSMTLDEFRAMLERMKLEWVFK